MFPISLRRSPTISNRLEGRFKSEKGNRVESVIRGQLAEEIAGGDRATLSVSIGHPWKRPMRYKREGIPATRRRSLCVYQGGVLASACNNVAEHGDLLSATRRGSRGDVQIAERETLSRATPPAVSMISGLPMARVFRVRFTLPPQRERRKVDRSSWNVFYVNSSNRSSFSSFLRLSSSS